MLRQSKIKILEGYERLCEEVAEEILSISNMKISMQNKFTMVLSGGSTPSGIYQCMASLPYRDMFQWDKIHFFWSDERWVPEWDQKSNFHMVSQALLTKVRIPSGNIHPIHTGDGDIQSCAHLYEETIIDFFKLNKDDYPCFDLVLLGLGKDGHTASLFPENPALSVKNRLAIEVSEKGITEERITMTVPVLNQAEKIFFIVSGDEKKDIVHEVLEGENRDSFPAHEIKSSYGNIFWFLDKAAASKLVNRYA
jgi:6-phosphogluconolactonase